MTLLVTLNLIGIAIGLTVCVSSTHVFEFLVGIAVIWLTGSTAAGLFFSRSGHSLEPSLAQLLVWSGSLSGAVLLAVAVLILSFSPDQTGVVVSIVLGTGTIVDLWALRRTHQRKAG